MWCDGFDGDLPQLVPDARDIIGDLGDVALWTIGTETDGALNHPDVWNGRGGLLAFFGFRGPCRPSGHVSSGTLIRCTAWEALRDAWPHGYTLHVEREPIWDTGALVPDLEALLREARCWPIDGRDPAASREAVRASLRDAVGRLRRVVDQHGTAARLAEAAGG